MLHCFEQSNVSGMLMRPLLLQAKLSFSWLWPLTALTAWNLTPCVWRWGTVSCEGQELVCATRGQDVNKYCSLFGEQLSNMKTIRRKALWCFIYSSIFCNWALKLYIGCEFVKNHFAIVSGSFFYQSTWRSIVCVETTSSACMNRLVCIL